MMSISSQSLGEHGSDGSGLGNTENESPGAIYQSDSPTSISSSLSLPLPPPISSAGNDAQRAAGWATEPGECQGKPNYDATEESRDVEILIGIDVNAGKRADKSPFTLSPSAIKDECLRIPETPPTTPLESNPPPFPPAQIITVKTKRAASWAPGSWDQDPLKDMSKSGYNEHIEWLREGLRDRDRIISQLTTGLDAVHAESGRLQNSAADHVAEIDRLQSELKAQGRSIAMVGSYLMEAFDRLLGLQRQIDKRNATLAVLTDVLGRTQAALRRQQQQQRDSNDDDDDDATTLTQLRALHDEQLAALRAELQACKDQLAALRTERDGAVARMQEARRLVNLVPATKLRALQHREDCTAVAAATARAGERLAMARLAARDHAVARLQRVLVVRDREMAETLVVNRELRARVRVLEEEGERLCSEMSRWKGMVEVEAKENKENGKEGKQDAVEPDWCDVGSVEV